MLMKYYRQADYLIRLSFHYSDRSNNEDQECAQPGNTRYIGVLGEYLLQISQIILRIPEKRWKCKRI